MLVAIVRQMYGLIVVIITVLVFVFAACELPPDPAGITYRVNFDANGGSGTVPDSQSVALDTSITIPDGEELTRSYYSFEGWNTTASGTGDSYSGGSTFTPTGNVTLYAQWEAVPSDSVTGLANKLAWLEVHGQSDSSYTVEVDTDESIAPHTLAYRGRDNLTITLIGVGANRTISLTSNGAMFSVRGGVTLVLDNNITLQGRSNNTESLVEVSYYGTFIMKEGSVITGNTVSSAGGGVYVSGGSTFTMEGGEISGNTVASTDSDAFGGGVYVYGTFTMNDGKISGNTASGNGGGVTLGFDGTFTMSGGEISGNTVSSAGGGVYVSGGSTFTMEGGEISGNMVASTGSDAFGGGVWVGGSISPGTFTMSGGKISGNTVSSSRDAFGGGVHVGGIYASGNFTMNGGEISGNTVASAGSDSSGGGVYVNGNNNHHSAFTMTSGTISGNTATTSGGGVYVRDYGTFTLSGGTISGNTASGDGGGVYGSGNLTMSDGIISDNTASGDGGGVYVRNYGGFTLSGGTISGNIATSGGGVHGNFTMSNGTISGNTATSGGGVYGGLTLTGGAISGNTATFGGGVYVSGTINKTGGTITGYASDPVNGNVVKDSNDTVYDDQGHAVYTAVTGDFITKRQETTAGPGDNLFYNSTNGTSNGAWDY